MIEFILIFIAGYPTGILAHRDKLELLLAYLLSWVGILATVLIIVVVFDPHAIKTISSIDATELLIVWFMNMVCFIASAFWGVVTSIAYDKIKEVS